VHVQAQGPQGQLQMPKEVKSTADHLAQAPEAKETTTVPWMELIKMKC